MMITKKIGIPLLFLTALTLIFILLSTSENYVTIDLFNKVKGPIFTEIFPEGKRNSGGFKWFKKSLISIIHSIVELVVQL